MADQRLCAIEIDLAFSKNPKLYYMYDRPELGREITAFLKKHGLKIVGSELGGTESGRNPTHIKLDGPSTGIKKFVAEYLSEDAPAEVYKLLYDGGVKG
jgi:hypothetical protein